MTADMQGKVCVVTGANSGIGKETALGLAQLGATVVLVCRSQERGAAALAEIKQRSGNDSVALLVADLSSQRQVRRVAAAYRQQFDRLDVLVNNAALARRKRAVTEDGVELTLAVNHLAPFLLTNLLLDRLKASAPARVVTVSSAAHKDADDQLRRFAERADATLLSALAPTVNRSWRTYSSPMSWRAVWRERASRPTACTPASSPRVSSAIHRCGCGRDWHSLARSSWGPHRAPTRCSISPPLPRWLR